MMGLTLRQLEGLRIWLESDYKRLDEQDCDHNLIQKYSDLIAEVKREEKLLMWQLFKSDLNQCVQEILKCQEAREDPLSWLCDKEAETEEEAEEEEYVMGGD